MLNRLLSFIFLFQFVTTTIVKAQGTRLYYTNRLISGQTEDSQGANYLLLHKIYTTTLLPDNYVLGKITAIRGGVGTWNRKWTVEVNTASAYNTNRGSIICYNEPATLVTLTYNSESYLAVSITNGSSLHNFSFTGYAQNESLLIAYDDNVSNVQPFSSLDPITIQGNVGIGNTAPTGKLHITAPQGTAYIKLTQSDIAEADATMSMANATGIAGTYIPLIRGRSYTNGRPFGLSLQGEADDVVPAGSDLNGGAIVLDGRSKNASALVNNNVLAVNTYGNNLVVVKADGSVGIGATDTKGYKLAVNGSAIFTRVKVKAYAGWPDFVFAPGYQLPSLREVERFINENKHLPEVPSEKEVVENGLDLGEMDKKLLQKVEELTLYLIDQQKQINQLKKQNESQQQEIDQLQISKK